MKMTARICQYGYAGRTPQRTLPRSGGDSASTDANVFYDVDAYDNHNTVLAAFGEAGVQDVDGQVEVGSTIRALLSTYPLSEMARDVAAAFLCVFFVVVVALLIIGVWG
jgi:hypothetical protein